MKGSVVRNLLFVVLFVAVFVLLQNVVALTAAGLVAVATSQSFSAVLGSLQGAENGGLYAVISVFFSLVVIAVFWKTGWTPVSRSYLRSKPWTVLAWVVLLALGSILPSEFLSEKAQLMMPEGYQQLFENIMKSPWGYVALGLLVPVSEEMVFRGAVLRCLLNMSDRRWHWIPIVLSAAVFGLIHLNLAQGVHAFFIGLLLGWMYYRTESIVPCVLFHWINNSVAYIMFHLLPDMNDGKLIDLFHGSDRLMYGGLFFSLCILIPSVLQLNMRMKR
ncbi:CPBP family intramembrane glutamic endopeptidase [Prevotella dentasini]|uniref:CPBP family intramembrane glutamic endopeptidase n=1 Tax=Prevotella dentasini TaxID=589537 RepID=UPI000467FEE8|nr:type II CAAX endopeptidase family protein [Prevotella dentasini]